MARDISLLHVKRRRSNYSLRNNQDDVGTVYMLRCLRPTEMLKEPYFKYGFYYSITIKLPQHMFRKREDCKNALPSGRSCFAVLLCNALGSCWAVSSLPQAAGSGQQQDPALPCRGTPSTRSFSLQRPGQLPGQAEC